jgi:predicted phage baseplate assembly protein
MPVPVPKLDTRTWAELTGEARTLVPRLAPDWTDHNLHDPGITLLELLAWLSELLLFRVDRVSPAMRRAFLRLVGVTPEPAGVAETVVAFRPTAAAASAVPVPARARIADRENRVAFETVAPLRAAPVWLELGDEGTNRGRLVSQVSDTALDVTALNMGDRPFEPFGPSPEVGYALLLGFEHAPVPPSNELSLFVWTDSWIADAVTARRLDEERRAVEADCASRRPRQSWPTHAQCAEGIESPPPAAATAEPPPWHRHYSARTVWEFWNGAGWSEVGSALDETRALSLTGRVRLAGATGHAAGPLDSRYWLRCRLAAGGYDCPPRLRAIAVNAVPVRNAVSVLATRQLGTSRGGPRETYELGDAPVVAGSTVVRVTKADGTLDGSWEEVAEWDETQPDDRHYRLDPEFGTIRFGDGRVGRALPAGATISVVRYAVGGDEGGNVPAGTLVRRFGPYAAALAVVQPFPALGGGAAERLDHAHGRALDHLAARVRGVTASDLEELARETPGVPVKRAVALPALHPDHACLPAPGVVTVVVLPRCGDPPVPSPELLATVRRYLERRRPLTTELHVVGPEYVAVTVSATLRAGGPAGGIAAAAQAALDRFFDPLAGGQDGRGWPFGRDVVESEVLAVLDAVPGVAFVHDVAVFTDGDARPRCGNLPLCGIQLVDSKTHRLTVVEE